MKQKPSELLLQQLDCACKGGLRYMAFAGGPGKIQLVADREEIANLMDLHTLSLWGIRQTELEAAGEHIWNFAVWSRDVTSQSKKIPQVRRPAFITVALLKLALERTRLANWSTPAAGPRQNGCER